MSSPFLFVTLCNYFTLKLLLQINFDGTLTCNTENAASFIPTLCPKYLFGGYVTWVEQLQDTLQHYITH